MEWNGMEWSGVEWSGVQCSGVGLTRDRCRVLCSSQWPLLSSDRASHQDLGYNNEKCEGERYEVKRNHVEDPKRYDEDRDKERRNRRETR